MTHKIILLLLLLPFSLLAQKTKKVTVQHESPEYKELFHVLENDTAMKQGPYLIMGYNKKIWERGFYKDGKKDSLWTTYFHDGKRLKVRGLYKEGNQTGVWEYYDLGGILEQKYDFNTKEIVYFKYDTLEQHKVYKVITEKDTIHVKLDKPPLYLYGSVVQGSYISNNIKYPVLAMDNKVSGTVLISFIIDSQGKTSHHKILKGIGSGCDEEALRVVKLIPDHWIAAQLHGKPVGIEYIMPISFVIE